jgi:hypothetical protein
MAEQWSYLRPGEKAEDVDRSWTTQEEAEQDLALDLSFAHRHGRDESTRKWTHSDYALIVREVSEWKVVE